jgi:hypothetical protein
MTVAREEKKFRILSFLPANSIRWRTDERVVSAN